MRAKEIMRKKVITVKPEMTLLEVAKLFSDHHITGAPVVSPEGRVVGVISQTDLIRHEREAPSPSVPVYHQEPEESARASGFHYEAPDYTRVDQVMTPWAISFEEDTPVRELADQMLRKHIHRIIITKDGELAGIVTSMDMLRALVAMLPRSRHEAAAESTK